MHLVLFAVGLVAVILLGSVAGFGLGALFGAPPELYFLFGMLCGGLFTFVYILLVVRS
jgi:hypothetical protein